MMNMTPEQLERVLGTFASELHQQIRKESRATEVKLRHEILANQLQTQHEMMEVQKKLQHEMMAMQTKIRHQFQAMEKQAHLAELSEEALNNKLEALTEMVCTMEESVPKIGELPSPLNEESDWFGENTALREWATWIHDSLLGVWPDETT
ncbi:uncharacterized protein Triagg1_2613 [Trichoderma aggressivum f. europaeum]|uniref:Uncharacterized protein n=1 Tax=Trichoderma aggressivum f. europaeum TaxID=173218 RepID=A0AAE1II50_9HYPO|nr:hypothetical protein Triagg1_2613 [Trichoderma aggressivum f. europaeum]